MPIAKEALSLKRFILRSEVLKLYRNYMKVGRLIEKINDSSPHAKALRQEWTVWVRDEFKIRKGEEEEGAIRMLIAQGQRQLSELERSTRLRQGRSQIKNRNAECLFSPGRGRLSPSFKTEPLIVSFHTVHTACSSLLGLANRYDPSRVKEAGPDRAAAEWLIRCGAGVKWTRAGAGMSSPDDPATSTEWFRDYNALPQSYDRSLRISEIDGTDSALMDHGFKYLQGLSHVRRIILHRATYIEDEALAKLKYVDSTLKDLQVSSCGNVTVYGIRSLVQLHNLEHLLLYDLPHIGPKMRLELIELLQSQLPKCRVEFPYAQASEQKKQHEELMKKEKEAEGSGGGKKVQ